MCNYNRPHPSPARARLYVGQDAIGVSLRTDDYFVGQWQRTLFENKTESISKGDVFDVRFSGDREVADRCLKAIDSQLPDFLKRAGFGLKQTGNASLDELCFLASLASYSQANVFYVEVTW